MHDIVLRSSAVFTGTAPWPLPGWVAIDGDVIAAVGTGTPPPAKRSIDGGDGLISPGFIDTHTFFPGWAAQRAGIDLDAAATPEQTMDIVGGLLTDRSTIDAAFAEYQRLLASRGVTSVKEMAFDDYCGFADILASLDAAGELTVRVAFMSQPIARPLDVDLGRRMRDQYRSEFLFFDGFNMMTDGSLGDREADLIEPYRGSEEHCAMVIDYAAIEAAVLAADAAGFRVALHAQGDGAVRASADIFSRCRRGEDGRLTNRHAITDLELTNVSDLHAMGQLGVTAEVYPQITSRKSLATYRELIDTMLGSARSVGLWNRRGMLDSGIVVSCATDLPLLIPDIPASIRHASGGYCGQDSEPFQRENTVPVGDLLAAWTIGGAHNLGVADRLGTLEVGKRADIAVLNTNPFGAASMDDAAVCLTLSAGRIVFEG